MSDKKIFDHITELVAEEHLLRSETAVPGENNARLMHLAQQLDQCWDLLRQRRAKREFGEAAGDAHQRDVTVVESYTG